MIGYAVASCPEDNDSDETIHRVEDTAVDALDWCARYCLYRAYGNVPSDTLVNLIRLFDTLKPSGNISNQFNMGGTIFYVREYTEEDAKKALA